MAAARAVARARRPAHWPSVTRPTVPPRLAHSCPVPAARSRRRHRSRTLSAPIKGKFFSIPFYCFICINSFHFIDSSPQQCESAALQLNLESSNSSRVGPDVDQQLYAAGGLPPPDGIERSTDGRLVLLAGLQPGVGLSRLPQQHGLPPRDVDDAVDVCGGSPPQPAGCVDVVGGTQSDGQLARCRCRSHDVACDDLRRTWSSFGCCHASRQLWQCQGRLSRLSARQIDAYCQCCRSGFRFRRLEGSVSDALSLNRHDSHSLFPLLESSQLFDLVSVPGPFLSFTHQYSEGFFNDFLLLYINFSSLSSSSSSSSMGRLQSNVFPVVPFGTLLSILPYSLLHKLFRLFFLFHILP